MPIMYSWFIDLFFRGMQIFVVAVMVGQHFDIAEKAFRISLVLWIGYAVVRSIGAFIESRRLQQN